MSTYKVIVRNSPGWRSFEACTLGVSVTSPNWQYEYFASILDFAAAHFKKIRIDVTDLLYRHNFTATGQPPEEAAAQANRLGGLWLNAHWPLVEACPVRPDVIRWGKWYEHPDYVTVLEQFKSAAGHSAVLRDAVNADVEGFFRRQGTEPTDADREHSRAYLIEELAVSTLQARELPSLKLYPGDELLCMNVVRRGLVSEAPRGVEREQFAKVRFHTRGTIEAANDVAPSPAPGRPAKSSMPNPTSAPPAAVL